MFNELLSEWQNYSSFARIMYGTSLSISYFPILRILYLGKNRNILCKLFFRSSFSSNSLFLLLENVKKYYLNASFSSDVEVFNYAWSIEFELTRKIRKEPITRDFNHLKSLKKSYFRNCFINCIKCYNKKFCINISILKVLSGWIMTILPR